MNNAHLRTEFMQLCKDRSLFTENAASVYPVFLKKIVHARFAVVFRAWKEEHVKKNGSVTLRQKLKVQSNKSGKGKKRQLPPEAVTPSDEGSKRRRPEWKSMTMPILKDELRKRKLRVTGNKNDLTQRLQEYDNNLDVDFEKLDNNDEITALDLETILASSQKK